MSRGKESNAKAAIYRQGVTIKDVAERAGVALGTVSRTINGNSTVAPEIRERVFQVIRELGYRPNATARSMRSGKSHVVGCVVSSVSQQIAAEMIAAAEVELRKAGYAMIIANTHYNKEDEANVLNFMEDRGVDGLIIATSSDEDPLVIKRLQRTAIPIVLWERDVSTAFSAVLTDHGAGTNIAAAYLLGLGHRRISIIAAHRETWVGREQVAGFLKAVASPPDQGSGYRVDFTDKQDPDSLRKILTSLPRPTAIIANIHDVPSILRIARDEGLSIPRELSIVSLGDAELLEVAGPPITAIRGSGQTVGRSAAQLLLRTLSGQHREPSEKIIVPVELVIRGSCTKPSK